MVFVIKPLGAELSKDEDHFGKADPYCVIHIGGEKYQTKPHSGAGQKPKWNESFEFLGYATELKVQVYDDDIGKDEFYGEGTLNLNKWMSNPGKAQTDCVDIYLKDKKSGIVTLTIEYSNQGGNSNAGKLGY